MANEWLLLHWSEKEIMKKLENIFFSATSSGETLSIAASIATIKKIREQNVVDKLIKYGKKLNYVYLKKYKKMILKIYWM